MYISPRTGKFQSQKITLGARGDSYYEYLLKEWIQTNGTASRPLRMYSARLSRVREKG